MTSREFCIWLHGYVEISESSRSAEKGLTAAQVARIRRQLELVSDCEAIGKPAPSEAVQDCDRGATPNTGSLTGSSSSPSEMNGYLQMQRLLGGSGHGGSGI